MTQFHELQLELNELRHLIQCAFTEQQHCQFEESIYILITSFIFSVSESDLLLHANSIKLYLNKLSHLALRPDLKDSFPNIKCILDEYS